MIKILLVEDHAIVREGLKLMLEGAEDIQVVGEAANGNDAIQWLRKDRLNMVLLDISLPGKSGLEVLKRIQIERPGLPVLILSMYPEDQYAVRVLKAGAAGYLSKESAPGQLVKAIRKVAHGGRYISEYAAERLAGELDFKPVNAPHELLSNRELEILCKIASGKTPAQIAEELHLSIKTIGTYRARTLRKMNMKNTAELIRYAIKNGLVI
ncbi:MAG: response regulator transcription factor [Gammaproteobacteria bacterium]|nr:response regulator transcription factor [Gammaproteobacteria bacterium]